ncbi:MAG: N-acetylglutaminylglutamine synthetase [Actinomycetes bacterium]
MDRDTERWVERSALSTESWREPPQHFTSEMGSDVVLECGWGRLVFGQTFDRHDAILAALRAEKSGRRDICIYVRDPHVLVSLAPDELFVDPSFTYRLDLHRYRPRREQVRDVVVRKMREEKDADEVNRIYAACGMVTAPSHVLWDNQRTKRFTYLVAEDARSGRILGTVTGIDHTTAFDDPEHGTSLWCLAVDPQCTVPNVGEALVRVLAERYIARGRAYLDLSVLHDNTPAIRLYRKLGFRRVPVFCVKRKNPINEPLFSPGIELVDRLNPYARMIADEARRRGILVEVLDPDWGEMRLSHGGRTVLTRESLSELTTAVAMSRCDDKRVTRRIFAAAGLRVARGQLGGDEEQDAQFLAECGELVVKPARGEQGNGITVGVTKPDHLARAVEHARAYCPEVLLEECVEGDDLRIIVIDYEVVAAAVRRPATITGTGRHTVRQLIDTQSRRREAATGGESRIPLDETTVQTVQAAGFDLDDVLDPGQNLRVRRTANLHTGGTMHDVTADLHPALADAAVRASRAIGIPVTGLDMLVPSVSEADYVLVEANERPGLANHDPQPTAERFVDMLFPATRAIPRGWRPERPRPAGHVAEGDTA